MRLQQQRHDPAALMKPEHSLEGVGGGGHFPPPLCVLLPCRVEQLPRPACLTHPAQLAETMRLNYLTVSMYLTGVFRHNARHG